MNLHTILQFDILPFLTPNCYNVKNYPLYPSASSTEGTSETILDIVSNGFKLRGTGGAVNSNGTGYIYYAVCQSLVGSNIIPCVAR